MENNYPLSYSSSNLIKNCSQKYWHYKVDQTPKDSDADDSTEAFDVGKAFHEVLELNNHTENNLLSLLATVVKKYEVDPHKNMIHAMLLRYLQVHSLAGLKAHRCEVQIQTPEVIGFIDVILVDKDMNWWMGDMKTAGRFMGTTKARLASDPQLNLYAYHATKLAPFMDLDPDKFMGCRYRVTTKSKLVQKLTESNDAHVKRIAKNVKSYDIVIPKGIMKIEETYKRHVKYHKKSIRLRTGEEAPEKNLSYCDSFFRPCEYWSNCHGVTYTEASKQFEVVSSTNA